MKCSILKSQNKTICRQSDPQKQLCKRSEQYTIRRQFQPDTIGVELHCRYTGTCLFHSHCTAANSNRKGCTPWRCQDARHKTDKQRSFVAGDTWSQALYTSIVYAKGNGDVDSAKGLKHFKTSFGYKIMEFKTDGEPRFWISRRKLRSFENLRHCLKINVLAIINQMEWPEELSENLKSSFAL